MNRSWWIGNSPWIGPMNRDSWIGGAPWIHEMNRSCGFMDSWIVFGWVALSSDGVCEGGAQPKHRTPTNWTALATKRAIFEELFLRVAKKSIPTDFIFFQFGFQPDSSLDFSFNALHKYIHERFMDSWIGHESMKWIGAVDSWTVNPMKWIEISWIVSSAKTKNYDCATPSVDFSILIAPTCSPGVARSRRRAIAVLIIDNNINIQ